MENIPYVERQILRSNLVLLEGRECTDVFDNCCLLMLVSARLLHTKQRTKWWPLNLWLQSLCISTDSLTYLPHPLLCKNRWILNTYLLNTYLLQRLLQIKGGQKSLKLSSILGKQYETTIPHEPVFIAAKSLCILRWSERRLRKSSTVLFVTRDFLRTFNGLAGFLTKKKNTSLLVLIHQRALRQRIRCRRMSL